MTKTTTTPGTRRRWMIGAAAGLGLLAAASCSATSSTTATTTTVAGVAPIQLEAALQTPALGGLSQPTAACVVKHLVDAGLTPAQLAEFTQASAKPSKQDEWTKARIACGPAGTIPAG